MKTRKNTVKPAMAMVTALFLLGGYSAQTAAGTVDLDPTIVGSSNLLGCVSTLATDLECPPAGAQPRIASPRQHNWCPAGRRPTGDLPACLNVAQPARGSR